MKSESRILKPKTPIPVVDLFAGPGGLGEGFAAFQSRICRGAHPFRVCLSVEKDEHAHKTLLLRSFYRQFDRGNVPGDYYDHLRNADEVDLETLLNNHPDEKAAAELQAWRATLGQVPQEVVDERIEKRLAGAEIWVLIGGPPCQAYSIIGRSRMKNFDQTRIQQDERHRLYEHYLQILANHQPPIFVLENVKGLLSSKVGEEAMFSRIRTDLEDPAAAVGTGNGRGNSGAHKYNLYSFTTRAFAGMDLSPSDFIIQSELYGIPQYRHRVLLLGVRDDIQEEPGLLKASADWVTVRQVIGDMPRLRSGLSREEDTAANWLSILRSVRQHPWFVADKFNGDGEVLEEILKLAQSISPPRLQTGRKFIKTSRRPDCYQRWYYDPKLGGVCNHEARQHRADDLLRYLYVATYGKITRLSPKLDCWPDQLLPNHVNLKDEKKKEYFDDRFKVQVWHKPASTITSHMCKDGHYFIHPDPTQCRSLTVREAARLQTFPDNYYFEGMRTAQYQQVGNAVPPLLARKLAGIVYDLLVRSFGT